MPTRVRTPDGGTAVFPDGMSDDQITAVLRREYPSTAAPSRPSAPPMMASPTGQYVTQAPTGIKAVDHALSAELLQALHERTGALVNDLKAPADATIPQVQALKIGGDLFSLVMSPVHAAGATLGRYIDPGGYGTPGNDDSYHQKFGTLAEALTPLPGFPEAKAAAEAGAGVRTIPRLTARRLPDAAPVTSPPLRANPPRVIANAAELPPTLPPLSAGRGAEPLGPSVRPLTAGRPPAPPGLAPAPTPAVTAAKEAQVGQVLQRAVQRDQLSPRALDTALKRDPSALPFHAGGNNLVTLADVAAQSPGDAQNLIKKAIEAHRGDVPNQVRGDIGHTLGGQGDYLDTLTQMQTTRREAANAGMAQIGDHLVTLDENSVSALRSDHARGAIKDAAANALASPDPEVRAAGAGLNRLHDQLLDKPSAITIRVRDAQDISGTLLRRADSIYKAAERGGVADTGTAKNLKALGRAVRDNAASPERGGFQEYADWLHNFGTAADSERALQLGMGVFTNGLKNTPAYVKKALSELKGPQAVAQSYAKGAAESLIEMVRTGKGDIGMMRQLLRDENVRDRLRIAFPDQASFDAFVARAEARVRQQDINNRVYGGSQTYGRGAAKADLEAQGPSVAEQVGQAIDVAHTLSSPKAMAVKGAKLLLNQLPKVDRSVIGDPQANAILGKALTDPEEFRRLLGLATSAPKVGPRATARATAPMLRR